VITLARRGKVRSRARIFGSAPDPEALRKNIVRLCFVIYWLLIFEGALRKWAFPSLASVLFFIRDPFLLLVYLMALRGPLPKGWRVLSFGCLVAALYCYLAGVQVLLGYSTLSVAAYGLHNYFLYFPLAWMIYTYFNAKDVQRLLRQTLFVAVPIAVLVAVQFVSSPDAVINKGTSQAGEGVFIVVEGIVRPYGTLTLSIITGVAVLLLLMRGRAGLKLSLREMMPDGPLIRRLLRISIPASIDTLSICICQLWFCYIIHYHFGSFIC